MKRSVYLVVALTVVMPMVLTPGHAADLAVTHNAAERGEDAVSVYRHAPREVVVGLRGGGDILEVSRRIGLSVLATRRAVEIGPIIERVRNALRLKRDRDGRYPYHGRLYDDPADIPSDLLFEQAYRGMSQREKNIYGSFVVRIADDTTVADTLMALRRDAAVRYAEPNYLARTSFTPDDTRYDEQWAHQVTQAESGWDIETGDAGVVIAIIDTGVAHGHEDLAPNMWDDGSGNPGRDFVDIDPQGYLDSGFSLLAGEDYIGIDDDPIDFYGHGSHVAGIAAGAGNNMLGVAGVCHACRIMAVRAGFAIQLPGGSVRGLLESDDVAAAITYAADQGADIINMSFGSNARSQLVADAVAHAFHDRGVTLFAAAGNLPVDLIQYPAGEPEVNAVAASAIDDTRAWYSTYGMWVDVAAPGGDAGKDPRILSTVPFSGPLGDPSGYAFLQGTSMASPYVAGVAGLLLSNAGALTNTQVGSIVRASTDPGDFDAYVGTGRINVADALQVVAAPTAQAEITAPISGAFVGGPDVDVFGTASAASYVLEISEDPYAEVWALVSAGTTVTDGLLGTVDATTLTPATTYYLRVTANDTIPVTDAISLHYNPALAGGWQRATGAPALGSPTIFDLDGDGSREVILATYGSGSVPTDSGQVFIWRADGSDHPGWPRELVGGPLPGTPAVGDLEGDGDGEIVVAGWAGVRVLDDDGSDAAGWPKPNYAFQSPVLANLDGDGDLEIIVPADLGTRGAERIYAWHHDGTLVAGWPLEITGASSVAAADLDSDGLPEIIFGTRGSDNDVFDTEPMEVDVVHGDASPVAGWPRPTVGWIKASPSAGDIDADGEVEIVAKAGSRVYAWEADGTPLPGWPLALGSVSVNTPVILTDLDGDEDLEIVFASDAVLPDFSLRAYHHDATPVAGWPVIIEPSPTTGNNWGAMQPVAADIDGDGDIEVVLKAADRLFAFHDDGSVVDGFPFLVPDNFANGTTQPFPAVGDLDADGTIEIVAAGNRDSVLLFDLPSVYDERFIDWPMYQHDPANTGLYGDLCGNGRQDGLEECDDGNVVNGDGCDANCTVTRCGNRVVTDGEECDDGNLDDMDCCSSACVAAPIGVPCPDGDVCNGDETCDGAGECGTGTPVVCSDDGVTCTAEACDPLIGCAAPPQPMTTCKAPIRAKISILDKADDARDKLSWKWLRGEIAFLDAYGDPTLDTDYDLCVWDTSAGNPLLTTTLHAPPGADWRPIHPFGHFYRDKTGASDGLVRLQLKPGTSLSARLRVKAKGLNLPMPAPAGPDRFFAHDPSVIVQLANSEGFCWTSEFLTSQQNESDRFKATAR